MAPRTPRSPRQESDEEGNRYTAGGPPTAPPEGSEDSVIVRRPDYGPFSERSRPVDVVTQPMGMARFERYFAGQQALIGRMTPGALTAIQRELAAVGLLSSDYANGTPDAPTKDAFGQLLGIANEWGLSWRGALTRMMSQTSDQSARERGYRLNPETGQYESIEEEFIAPPLNLQLPNKLDVDRVIRQSSIELLGEGWSPEQIDRVSNSFMGEVTRVQQAAHAQEVDRMSKEFYGQPGASEQITSVEPPSAEAFAEEQIKQQDPEGYQVNSGMELLLGLVNQWGGMGG